jgi:hypothetical protein
MNTNLKKALLIFGGGLLVYWAFKKLKPIGSTGSKKSTPSSVSAPTEEQKKNAAIALKAYEDAESAGESVSFLGDMNKEFSKEYEGILLKKYFVAFDDNGTFLLRKKQLTI